MTMAVYLARLWLGRNTNPTTCRKTNPRCSMHASPLAPQAATTLHDHSTHPQIQYFQLVELAYTSLVPNVSLHKIKPIHQDQLRFHARDGQQCPPIGCQCGPYSPISIVISPIDHTVPSKFHDIRTSNCTSI